MMVPLTTAREGDLAVIKRVSGKQDTRLFLEKLGFVQGSRIKLISRNSGNLIVGVKESRVAINRELAAKIFV